MINNEELKSSIMDGYLSHLCELEIRNGDDVVSQQAKVKYKTVQIFLMYLVATYMTSKNLINSDQTNDAGTIEFSDNIKLPIKIWLDVSQYYPSILRVVLGHNPEDYNKLNDINIPDFNVKRDVHRVPEIWDNLALKDQKIIYSMFQRYKDIKRI